MYLRHLLIPRIHPSGIRNQLLIPLQPECVLSFSGTTPPRLNPSDFFQGLFQFFFFNLCIRNHLGSFLEGPEKKKNQDLRNQSSGRVFRKGHFANAPQVILMHISLLRAEPRSGPPDALEHFSSLLIIVLRNLRAN